MQALMTILAGMAIYFGCMALIAFSLLALQLGPRSWRYTAEEIELIVQALETAQTFEERLQIMERDVNEFVVVYIGGMHRRATTTGAAQ